MARPAALPEQGDTDLLDDMVVSPEEGRRMFDEAARKIAGISGAEFIRCVDAGEYAEMPDDVEHRELVELAMLVNVGR